MFQRLCVKTTVTVTDAVATCEAFDYRNFSGGQVYVPTTAGASITGLTWWGSHDGITFVPVQDGAGSAVTSSITHTKCCLIPAACFACAFLKAVGNAAGTIEVTLKS